MDDDPLLHESLDFPLDDLGSLSTSRLCLVQFHPEADEQTRQSAELIYWRRRNRAQAVANRTQRQRTRSAAVSNASGGSVAPAQTPAGAATADQTAAEGEPKQEVKEEETKEEEAGDKQGEQSMQVDTPPTASTSTLHTEDQPKPSSDDKQPLPSALKKPITTLEGGNRLGGGGNNSTAEEEAEFPPDGLDPIEMQMWRTRVQNRQQQQRRRTETQAFLETRLAESRALREDMLRDPQQRSRPDIGALLAKSREIMAATDAMVATFPTADGQPSSPASPAPQPPLPSVSALTETAPATATASAVAANSLATGNANQGLTTLDSNPDLVSLLPYLRPRDTEEMRTRALARYNNQKRLAELEAQLFAYGNKKGSEAAGTGTTSQAPGARDAVSGAPRVPVVDQNLPTLDANSDLASLLPFLGARDTEDLRARALANFNNKKRLAELEAHIAAYEEKKKNEAAAAGTTSGIANANAAASQNATPNNATIVHAPATTYTYPRDPVEAARLFRERVQAVNPAGRQAFAQEQLKELGKIFHIERVPPEEKKGKGKITEGGASGTAQLGAGSARLRPRVPPQSTWKGTEGSGIKRTRSDNETTPIGSSVTSPNKRPRPLPSSTTPPVTRHLQARAGDPRTVTVRFGDSTAIDRLLQLQAALGYPPSIEETLDRLTMLAEEDKAQLPDYNTWCKGLLSIWDHASKGEDAGQRAANFAVGLQALDLGNRSREEMEDELSTLPGGSPSPEDGKRRERRSPAPSVSTVAANENARSVQGSGVPSTSGTTTTTPSASTAASSEPMRYTRSRAPSASTVAADENANHASEYGSPAPGPTEQPTGARFRDGESVIPAVEASTGTDQKKEEEEDKKDVTEAMGNDMETDETKEETVKPKTETPAGKGEEEPSGEMDLDDPDVKTEPKQEEKPEVEIEQAVTPNETKETVDKSLEEEAMDTTEAVPEPTVAAAPQSASSTTQRTPRDSAQSAFTPATAFIGTTAATVPAPATVAALLASSRAGTPVGRASRSSSPADVKPKVPIELVSDLVCVLVNQIPLHVTFADLLLRRSRCNHVGPPDHEPVAICQLTKTVDEKTQYTRLYFLTLEAAQGYIKEHRGVGAGNPAVPLTMVVVKKKPKKSTLLWTDLLEGMQDALVEKGRRLGLTGLPDVPQASGRSTATTSGSASTANGRTVAPRTASPIAATLGAGVAKPGLAERLQAARNAVNNKSDEQHTSSSNNLPSGASSYSAASPTIPTGPRQMAPRENEVLATTGQSSSSANSEPSSAAVSSAELPTGPRNPGIQPKKKVLAPAATTSDHLISAQKARVEAAASFAARIGGGEGSSLAGTAITSTTPNRQRQQEKKPERGASTPTGPASLASGPRNPLLTRLSPSATPKSATTSAAAAGGDQGSSRSTNATSAQAKPTPAPSLLDRFGAAPSSSSPNGASNKPKNGAKNNTTPARQSSADGLLSRLD